jgi:hypothetical protein
MRTGIGIACLFLLLVVGGAICRAETPARLPLQVDGPVKVSPHLPRPPYSPAKDHYLYSTPTPFYPGWYGYGYYGCGWYAPWPCGFSWYGPARVIVVHY